MYEGFYEGTKDECFWNWIQICIHFTYMEPQSDVSAYIEMI
jgi:hypothetical protein